MDKTEMLGIALVDLWIFIGFFIIIIIIKYLMPKPSFEGSLSLWIMIGAGLVYVARFFILFLGNQNDPPLSPIVGFLLCCGYIYAGSKAAAFKTRSGIWSRITSNAVGSIEAGSRWIDPIWEYVSATISQKELLVEIPSTPNVRTKTLGILAKIKDIQFMLDTKDEETGKMLDTSRLLDITGGAETVRKRIVTFVEEFFMHKVRVYTAEQLDTDRVDITSDSTSHSNSTIHKLAHDLKEAVIKYCKKENYPYRVIGEVQIADTELPASYYTAAAENALAILREIANNTIADQLEARLLKLGNALMPSGTEKQKLEAAQISLKIIPKNISETKFSLDSDSRDLVKEIAIIFRDRKKAA